MIKKIAKMMPKLNTNLKNFSIPLPVIVEGAKIYKLSGR